MKKALLLALVAILLATFVSCGGDDGDEDEAGSTEGQVEEADTALSEEEFLAQGNKICADGTKEINAAAKELPPGPPKGEEAQAFFDTLVSSIQGQIDALGELEPPEDLAADVDALLQDAQAALDEIEDAGLEIFQREEDPFTEVNKDAKALGLTKCN